MDAVLDHSDREEARGQHDESVQLLLGHEDVLHEFLVLALSDQSLQIGPNRYLRELHEMDNPVIN